MGGRPQVKKPLEPLIPLEEFKKLVSAISRVPKEAVEKAKAKSAATKQRDS